jgi:hypothetical protein
MKRTIIKSTFIILITLSIPSISAEQSNSPYSENSNKYYIVNNPPPKSNNINLMMSIITSIISVASIFVVWYNVKRQISSVEKNIHKQFKLQEINNIRENIAEFIIEITKLDGGKLEEKEYVSEKHKELENKLLSFLDDSNAIDKKFINCITKFKNEELTDKNAWVNEILMLKNELVKSKI